MQIKVKPPIDANCNQFILRSTVGKIKKGSYPVSGKLMRKLSIIESTLGPYYMDHIGTVNLDLLWVLYKPLSFGCK